MPHASPGSAPDIADYAVLEDRSAELEGYTVNFATIRERHDLGPMLKDLPDGRCQCPHWGFLLKGRITVSFADREEVVEAGDAFYWPPGHVPITEAGSEVVQFSPSDGLRATEEAIAAAMKAARSA